MTDLISRAAARDVINTWGRQKSEKVRMGLLHRDLDAIPAVDAVPVVHGRWISYPECLAFESAYLDEHIVCSACHSVWNIIDNDSERFDYCPNCGAKMNGERRNSE